MEKPDFQLDSVCSLDSIQACSIPVSRNSLTALLYDFYLALIGLVAYFVLRPLGIALLIFCALAALVALGLQIWRLILRRKLRPIRTAGWQYLEASLAFYPDRVELDQWNGKGLHVTIPYARVTAVLLTEDLLLIQGGAGCGLRRPGRPAPGPAGLSGGQVPEGQAEGLLSPERKKTAMDERNRPAQPPSPEPPSGGGRETGPDYILNTYTDEAAIRAAMPALLPRWFTLGYPVVGCVMLAADLSMVGLFGLDYTNLLLLLLTGLIFLVRWYKPRRMADKQLARLRESYGTDRIPMELVFWPQGVAIRNQRTGGQLNLRYDTIGRTLRRGNYLILRTREKQAVILNLADLAGPPEPFLDYLRAKCPQAMKGI